MKLSYEWLKEYVKIDLTAEKIAQGLTMSGSEVGTIKDFGKDKIMELEITSNRPDCLNIIGLAREVSAVFDKALHLPNMAIPKNLFVKQWPRIECLVKKKKLCPYYTCRVISGVKVKPSADKIKARLVALGFRPVNNVVDVTNFCLIENGQPLHAFDLDKIDGGKIIVRESKKGEVITTIDGVERILEEGMLVIADTQGPVAIAGVMGAKRAEVTEMTKNVLLESAYFNPASVRRTSRLLGISTDSSYRFERGVDKSLIVKASDRAARFISEETGGGIGGFYEIGKLLNNPVSISFCAEKAEKILGISFKKEKIEKIFHGLGLKTKKGKKNKKSRVLVTVPSFREDIKTEIDLIEEVARIHGYDNIPETMAAFIPAARRKQHSRRIIEKTKTILSSSGLDEIMTYSLINETSAKRFSDIIEWSGLSAETQSFVSLRNPLSEEQKVLTPHLLDGMLRVVSWNLNRKNQDLGFFEIGKIYGRLALRYPEAKSGERSRIKPNDISETPALCVALTGVIRKNWKDGEKIAGFYDLKGIIENLFRRLDIIPEICPVKFKSLDNCAEIKIKSERIGFLGEIDKSILEEYSISQRVYICQILLDNVLKNAVLKKRFHSISRFPALKRDISILCDLPLNADSVLKVIFEAGGQAVIDAELTDIYQGDQIPAGKKSLSYGIKYCAQGRTLTDEEAETIHLKIKETLISKLNISFR